MASYTAFILLIWILLCAGQAASLGPGQERRITIACIVAFAPAAAWAGRMAGWW